MRRERKRKREVRLGGMRDGREGLRIEKGKKEKIRKRREEKGKKGPERHDKLRATAFLSNGNGQGSPWRFFFFGVGNWIPNQKAGYT